MQADACQKADGDFKDLMAMSDPNAMRGCSLRVLEGAGYDSNASPNLALQKLPESIYNDLAELACRPI